MPFERGNKVAPGGKRLGAGRKPDSWKRLVNLALTRNVTPEDLDSAFKMMVVLARSGSIRALELLLERTVGKVPQAQELSGPGGGPIEHAVLTDSERVERVVALLERARARGDGPAADGADETGTR